VILLVAGINGGAPFDSDVQLSTNDVCADRVNVRVENHLKNPLVPGTGFLYDLLIERYEVHYTRSDGRKVEGVDVPSSVTGNLSQVGREEGETTFSIEVVRRQSKLELPLQNVASQDSYQDVLTQMRQRDHELCDPPPPNWTWTH
jgi:hypothetical protein